MRAALQGWLICSLLAGAASGAPSVSRLRCEYLVNPQGLDIAQPRLSWQMNAEGRNQSQSAYRLQVASSPQRLAAGRADRWDSGRVASDASTQIAYAGQPLASRDRCYWRVRIWDQDGRASAWSEPARWSMGLLKPEDWHGQWIGSQAEPGQSSLEWGQAQWIWLGQTGQPDAEADKPAGTVWLRRTFEVPAGLTKAQLAVAADDTFIAWLGDQRIADNEGPGEQWRTGRLVDLTDRLTAGPTTLTLRVTNGRPSPAAAIARLVMESGAGGRTEVVTDGAWRAITAPGEGQSEPGWPWPPVTVFGAMGLQPWGQLAAARDGRAEAVSPMLRRDFTVAKPLVAAQLSVCGLGYHELYLDGRKVGDSVLEPAQTQFDKRALYVTHDVTSLLRPGRHALGVQLANGLYNQWVGDAWDFEQAPWRGVPKMLLQLDLEYADGTTGRVVSDGSWRQSSGPLQYDQMRVGVVYDARAEQPGWAQPGFKASGWQPASVLAAPTANLRAQRSEPIRVVRRLPVAKWTQPAPGVWVADIGQNMTGWARLSVQGPAGTAITLRYGELLTEDGRVDQSNIMALVHGPAFQQDTYLLAGRNEREEFEPRFDYHGFQYVEVTGLTSPPDLNTLVACQVQTDFERLGTFACSNQTLTDLVRLAHWSYESNFVGFPSDCPHREKNGWTGDAQLACELGLLQYASEAAYTRWLDDLGDAQRPDGKLPCIVPTGGWGYDTLDGPAWEGAYALIAYWLYQYRGDERILSDHYERLKRWVDYYDGLAKDGVVRYGLGDWVPWKAQTPSELTSTAYVIQCARIVAYAARLLDREDERRHYEAVAERLTEGWRREWWQADTKQVAGGTQTALAAGLYFGLVPDEDRAAVAEHLAQAVRATDGHLDFGILGSKYVLRALSDAGYADLAYQMATQTSQPSWGWWLTQGATTMWETWGTGASHNHIMFGDVVAWATEYLAGLRADPKEPGFQHFLVRPTMVDGLTSARAEHRSAYGQIVVDWTRVGEQLTLRLAVPANSSALVTLPQAPDTPLVEGVRAWNELTRLEDGSVALEVGSGHYVFQCQVR